MRRQEIISFLSTVLGVGVVPISGWKIIAKNVRKLRVDTGRGFYFEVRALLRYTATAVFDFQVSPIIQRFKPVNDPF